MSVSALLRRLPLLLTLAAAWANPASAQQPNAQQAEQLQARIAALAARLDAPARQHLLDDQAHWEKSRQPACAAGLLETVECLSVLYEERIALIDDLLACPRYPFASQQALIQTAHQNRLHIYAAYPRFDGTSANFASLNNGMVEVLGKMATTLRQAIDAAPPSQELWGYHQAYRLHCTSDVAISIEISNYAYGAGAAHPASMSMGVLIDLRTGGVMPPQTLFAPDSHWRERLTAFVVRDLKRQLEAKGNDDMPSAADMTRLMSEDRRFVFRRGRLVVVFDSGEIPPYSDGPRTVEIPYPVLRPFLAADAPLTD